MKGLAEALPASLNIDENILRSALLTVFVLVAGWILRIVLQKTVFKKIEHVQTRYISQKIFTYILTIVSIMVISSFWIVDVSQVGTFLGIFTAAIAITLKDLLLNIAGWFFLFVKKPFSIGDRIQIGSFSGDVIDISIFQFSILEIGNWVDADQSTGRIINIPNGQVFIQALANYNKGFDFIWNEVKVLVTFESDWALAKKILTEVVSEQSTDLLHDAKKQIQAASKQYMISYTNLTPIVYTSVKDSGVQLTVRYLCKPRNRRNTEHELWERILVEFKKEATVELAYPTQRFYRGNDGP